jgi:dTDP-4-amino-4,6-dideoxygalactose transaminase
MPESESLGDPSIVPFVDLRAQAAAIRERLVEAMSRVAESGQYVLGPETERLEAAVSERLGIANSIAVSSGSDALVVALSAAGVGHGDEVVTSPLSFFATAESILRIGAVPRFVDVDPWTLNIDATRVEFAITPRTRAIVPVHLFGVPAEIDRLAAMARQRGLVLVEDAAQAFGSRVQARAAGAWGSLGCFSFFPAKVLGAVGDAGMVVTADARLAERCRRLRTHGALRRDEHLEMGGNYRMDALQAAILSEKLAYVDRWVAARREHAAAYDSAFSDVAGLRIQRRGPIESWNAATYTVRVLHERRDAFRAWMTEKGVETAVYYRRPLHLQPALSQFGGRTGELPEAEKAAGEVVSLPLFPEMAESQRNRVIDAVREFFA